MNLTRGVRPLAAVSIAVLATSAGLATTAIAGSTSPTYTHKDTGRTVHLAVGTEFRVSLRTCADCGDSWKWAHRPDAGVVKLLSKRVVSKAKPPAVGGEASTIYTFKVVGAGRTHEGLTEIGPSGKVIAHFRLTEVAR
jgi:hypothetical protein